MHQRVAPTGEAAPLSWDLNLFSLCKSICRMIMCLEGEGTNDFSLRKQYSSPLILGYDQWAMLVKQILFHAKVTLTCIVYWFQTLVPLLNISLVEKLLGHVVSSLKPFHHDFPAHAWLNDLQCLSRSKYSMLSTLWHAVTSSGAFERYLIPAYILQ